MEQEVAEEVLRINRNQVRFGLAVAVVVLASLIVGPLVATTKPSPIPTGLARQFKFQLYYPQDLPTGYTVNNKSFINKDGSLIFSIKTPDGKSIAVSEQRLPRGDDIEIGPPDSPAGAPVQLTQHIDTPAGKAVIGLWGANYVSSLVADNTWIILNVSGLTVDQATAVSRSFQKL